MDCFADERDFKILEKDRYTLNACYEKIGYVPQGRLCTIG